jgi:hypothetical protein
MSRRLLLLNLLLVTAAVALSAALAGFLLPGAPPPAPSAALAPPPPPTPLPPAARPAAPLAAYDVVAARSLFNPARAETAAVVAPSGKPFLYGVVLRDEAPTAFLEDPASKKVVAYRLGDAVAGGQLERIEADRVVIRRAEGTLEVLLRDPSKPKAAATAAAGPAPPAAQPPRLPPQAVVPAQPGTPGAPPVLFRRPQLPVAPQR